MKHSIYLIIILLLSACHKEKITALVVTRSIQPSMKIEIQDKCFSNGIYRDSTLFLIAECSPEEHFIYAYDDSLREINQFGEKGRLFNEFNAPFFYRNSKLFDEDSIVQIYDLNLLHEKYMNLKHMHSANNFIDGKYFPSKLYYMEYLNQLDANRVVGTCVDASDGTFT